MSLDAAFQAVVILEELQRLRLVNDGEAGEPLWQKAVAGVDAWIEGEGDLSDFPEPPQGGIQSIIVPPPLTAIALQSIGRQKGDMSSALRLAQSSSGIRSSARFWPSCSLSSASS